MRLFGQGHYEILCALRVLPRDRGCLCTRVLDPAEDVASFSRKLHFYSPLASSPVQCNFHFTFIPSPLCIVDVFRSVSSRSSSGWRGCDALLSEKTTRCVAFVFSLGADRGYEIDSFRGSVRLFSLLPQRYHAASGSLWGEGWTFAEVEESWKLF